MTWIGCCKVSKQVEVHDCDHNSCVFSDACIILWLIDLNGGCFDQYT